MAIPDEIDDRLLDPVVADRHLRGADLRAIANVFERARGRGQRAWMTMAVCVGRAQAQGGRGDAVIERMAELFKLHRSRIARLGRIYREAILPRLEASTRPEFPLAEQAWYEIATEASGPLGRSTLSLLAEAEERKRTDPKYSTRRWKAELGITADPSAVKLRALLIRLVGVEDDAVEEFAQGDVDQNSELLQAASRVIHRAAHSARLSGARSVCRSVVDGHGELVVEEISADLAAQLGHTPVEMVGCSLLDFIWNAERARAALEVIGRGGLPGWVENSFEPGHLEFRHASGAKAILPLDYIVRRRSDGTLEGLELVPVHTDGAVRRPTLARAAQDDRSSTLPVEPAPRPDSLERALAVWVIDNSLRTVFVSPEIAGLLGTSAEEMVGRPVVDYAPDPTRWRGIFDLMRRASAPPWTAGWLPGAIHARARNGCIVELPLQLTRHYSPLGQFLGVTLYASATGVPDESPAPTVRPTQDGMWIIRTDDFETIFVSPEIAELLGSTSDEMVGRSALPFLTLAGDTVRATSDLKGSELLWAGHAGLRRFIRRDGTTITLHAESHPVHDARGQITHVAATFAADRPRLPESAVAAPPAVEESPDRLTRD